MIHLRFKMYDVFEYCILDLPTGVQGSADTAFFIWVLAFSVIASISLITCHFEELQFNIGNVDLVRLIMSLVTSVIRSRILHPWRILDTNYQEYLEGRISTIKSSRLTFVLCEQTICS